MKKRNENIVLVSTFGIIVGRVLNRVLPRYFGNKGLNIFIIILMAFVLSGILYLALMKYYMAAIMMVIMIIPFAIGAVGIILDNMILLSIALGFICIVNPILIKVITKK